METNPENHSHPQNPDQQMSKPDLQMILKEILSHTDFNNNVTYRNLKTTDDTDQLKILFEEWFPISYPDEFYTELLEGDSMNTLLAVYTALHNGQPVDVILGCIIYDFRPVTELLIRQTDLFRDLKSLYICLLGVVKELRNKRLATSLLQTVLNRAKQYPNVKTAHLDVLSSNQPAIRFYQKNGFVQSHVKKEYYEIDDKTFDSHVYCFYIQNSSEKKATPIFSLFNYVWNMGFTMYKLAEATGEESVGNVISLKIY